MLISQEGRKKGKGKRNGKKARDEGKEGERNKERKGRDIGKEEESVFKEMKVLGLLPESKVFLNLATTLVKLL